MEKEKEGRGESKNKIILIYLLWLVLIPEFWNPTWRLNTQTVDNTYTHMQNTCIAGY